MADYGSVGKSLAVSDEILEIDLGYNYGEYPDMSELSCGGTFAFYPLPLYQSDGAEKINVGSIIRIAQPWKGEGTVVEYLYIGGGISVY